MPIRIRLIHLGARTDTAAKSAEAEEEPIAPPVARQARQWAADIEDQYVPRYAAPVPERGTCSFLMLL